MRDKFTIGGSEVGRVCAVGRFLQEDFVLNNLPFPKWERNHQIGQKNSQLMVLIELLRNMKVSQHVQIFTHIVGT